MQPWEGWTSVGRPKDYAVVSLLLHSDHHGKEEHYGMAAPRQRPPQITCALPSPTRRHGTKNEACPSQAKGVGPSRNTARTQLASQGWRREGSKRRQGEYPRLSLPSLLRASAGRRWFWGEGCFVLTRGCSQQRPATQAENLPSHSLATQQKRLLHAVGVVGDAERQRQREKAPGIPPPPSSALAEQELQL